MALRTLCPAVVAVAALSAAACASVAEADPPRSTTPAARRAPSGRGAQATERFPQECGQDPFHADYGGLERGASVRLGRHREVDGDAFWAEAMDEYVGRITRIAGPRGVDEKGCPLVAVEIDDGEYDWRVRDLERVAPGAVDALAQATLAPGFPADPRTFVGTLVTEERFDRHGEGCAGIGGRAATLRLTLDGDFESIAFLAHGEADLTLMIHTPDDTWICADDVDDLDPVITGAAGRGVYEIFVGAYDSDAAGSEFRLGISEKSEVRAADLAQMNPTRIGAEVVSAPRRTAP